jgi:hypothetical protein
VSNRHESAPLILVAFALWHGLNSKVWAQTAIPDPTLTLGAVRTVDFADVSEHGDQPAPAHDP